MKKPTLYITVICIVLFLLTLIPTYHEAYNTANSNWEMADFEREYSTTFWFFYFSTFVALFYGIIWCASMGIYKFIIWALRLRRRAFVNQAAGLDR